MGKTPWNDVSVATSSMKRRGRSQRIIIRKATQKPFQIYDDSEGPCFYDTVSSFATYALRPSQMTFGDDRQS